MRKAERKDGGEDSGEDGGQRCRGRRMARRMVGAEWWMSSSALLTQLLVKAPGGHVGIVSQRAVCGQWHSDIHGPLHQHWRPITAQQVHTDSCHRRQVVPGAISWKRGALGSHIPDIPPGALGGEPRFPQRSELSRPGLGRS